MSDPRHPVPPAPVAERVRALEEALAAKELVSEGFLDAAAAQAEEEWSPRNGARVVARAWVDPTYRVRLLADGAAAAAELGFNAMNSEYLVVLSALTPGRPGAGGGRGTSRRGAGFSGFAGSSSSAWARWRTSGSLLSSAAFFSASRAGLPILFRSSVACSRT